MSPEELLIKTGLYKTITLVKEDVLILKQLAFFTEKIDSYCPSCNERSTFTGTEKLPLITIASGPMHNTTSVHAFLRSEAFQVTIEKTGRTFRSFSDYLIYLNGNIKVTLECARSTSHKLEFYLRAEEISNGEIRVKKVGQYPSMADISASDFKKYKALITEDEYRDLSKAMGLYSHGVGAGSFVYLRRIFERIIYSCAETKINAGEITRDEFRRKRMEDKIGFLKGYVPDFISENKSIYAVLSLGIHEMNEDECIESFDLVKESILLILDERIEVEAKIRKAAELKALMDKIKPRPNFGNTA